MSTYCSWLTHYPRFLGDTREGTEEHREQLSARNTSSSSPQSQIADLFVQLRSPLLRYLWDFRLSSGMAEEIVQEAFLKLYEELNLGRSIDTPRAWLFRVVHRLALKEMRRLRVREGSQALADDELIRLDIADLRPTPAEQLLSDEREERFKQALEVLSLRERQCLNLRMEGLRYREIGEVLDLSVTTVSDILRRAVATLREACYD